MTLRTKEASTLSLLGWPLLALVVVLSTLTSEPVSACSVCNGIQEEASRKAFVGTTALLTFLPLILVGIVVSLFVRRTLEQERRQEALRIGAVETETQRVA